MVATGGVQEEKEITVRNVNFGVVQWLVAVWNR